MSTNSTRRNASRESFLPTALYSGLLVLVTALVIIEAAVISIQSRGCPFSSANP